MTPVDMDDEALVTWGGDDLPRPLHDIAARVPGEYVPEITVEQGWWPLLVRLDARLAAIDPDYRIRRVAAQDGRLSFQLDPSTNGAVLQRLVNAAEQESATTCELCGRPGKPQLSGAAFYSVLCDEDA